MNTDETAKKVSPLGAGRVAAVIVIAIGAIFAARYGLSADSIQRLLTRVDQLGHWGPAALSAVYIIACVLVLPGSILTLAGGFLFGLWKGYLCVAVGSVLGASAAFGIGRTVGREWIRRRVEGNLKFVAIDRAVAQNGFKIVVLTRLSPVFPFNLLNFAYGVTGVRFRDYFWGSLVGMAPGTVMFVYLGSAMKSLADVFSGTRQSGLAEEILFAGGLAATVIVTIYVTRLAKAALRAEAGPVTP